MAIEFQKLEEAQFHEKAEASTNSFLNLVFGENPFASDAQEPLAHLPLAEIDASDEASCPSNPEEPLAEIDVADARRLMGPTPPSFPPAAD